MCVCVVCVCVCGVCVWCVCVCVCGVCVGVVNVLSYGHVKTVVIPHTAQQYYQLWNRTHTSLHECM